ncbi:MAG: AAA family ATPase [Proteobacteria bacterium]|nr:AAA family ATPase [Pseudomonadota bacterium]
MYLEYFGLQRHPFLITPDPSMFCSGGGRGEILDALIYAITSGEGIIKVVGEVGSGKTMLCRILEERLPESVEIVYLANPRLSPADIIYAIAFELKLPVTSTTERLLVMQHLQNYLLAQHGAGRSVVVFVEEAQGMPTETLEEIRLLSNLETHRHKLLQIVLFGQPELDNNLRKRDIRQLKERITHSFHLAPLGYLDVAEYIRFRLQAAGCSKSGLFLPKAERMIARASCGLIRRVNILADKALLAAYAAPTVSLSGSSPAGVGPRHVMAAIGDCEFSKSRIRPAYVVCVGLFLLVLAVATVFTWHRFDASSVVHSLLTPKALFNDSIPVASSGQAVDRERDESGPGNLRAEQVVQRPSPADEKQQEIVSEKVSIDPISSTLQPFPPLSQHLSHKTALLRPEGQQQNEGEKDKLASTTQHTLVVASGASLLEQRRRAATLWLQGVHPDKYTIQLLATDAGGGAYLEKFLRQISSPSSLEKIYICREQHGKNDMWVVLYDEFEGVTTARLAVGDLPKELRQYQPFVRSLSEVLLINRQEAK